MAVLKLSVVAALLGCGEALALRPSLSMQHAAGSSSPTTSAAAGRRTWLAGAAKLSIGSGAIGAAALGRPGPARADVQYELGPLKLVTEDDPSLQVWPPPPLQAALLRRDQRRPTTTTTTTTTSLSPTHRPPFSAAAKAEHGRHDRPIER